MSLAMRLSERNSVAYVTWIGSPARTTYFSLPDQRRISTVTFCLFLSDRPLRLDHLNVSFGICTRATHFPFVFQHAIGELDEDSQSTFILGRRRLLAFHSARRRSQKWSESRFRAILFT